MRRKELLALALAFCLGGPACGGSQKKAESAEGGSMSAGEARKYIDSLRKDQSAVPPDPTSMDQVFEILRDDDIRRFEGATRFTEGMQGVEGLSVRATIELMSADIYATVAQLVEELARRADQESTRLTEKKASGLKLTKSEEDKLKEAKETSERLNKAGRALTVLADEHREAGGSLSQEAIKQYSQSPEGYHAAAYYYLLDLDWLRYDDMMQSLEGAKIDDAGMSYFRGLESLYRNFDKEQAGQHLREALEKNPQLVRAQAELVLVQEQIDGCHAELLKLKAMKPDHPVVNIAGPAIESEFAVSQAVRNARDPSQRVPVEDVVPEQSDDEESGGVSEESGDGESRVGESGVDETKGDEAELALE